MIYSTEQIREIVAPIAQQFHLNAVYLFGSYARGEAHADSDIDLLVDLSGTNIKSLLSLGSVYCALEDALGKKIDLITLSSLEQETSHASDILFRQNLQKERVTLYAAS